MIQEANRPCDEVAFKWPVCSIFESSIQKCIIYGYYTGQDMTWDEVGIVDNGILVDKENVRIEDMRHYASFSPGEDADFVFIKVDEEQESEITQEEYEMIITPYLAENRKYSIIYNEYLLAMYGIEDLEDALMSTLDKEDTYPKAEVNDYDKDYFSTRIIPEEN